MQMNKVDYNASFEMTIIPFRPDLLRFCRQLAKSGWDGEDLYQETIIKAFRSYQRWPERVISKPYLFRIARNAWIDVCRRNRLTVSFEEIGDLPATNYSEWSRFDIREALEWAMDVLEPRQVALILLTDVFGFSPKETSDALGQPLTAVKAALHRARNRLIKAAHRQWLNSSEHDLLQANRKNEMVDVQLCEDFIQAFHHADIAALLDSYRNLTQHGVTIDRVTRMFDRVHFYFLDPNGNPMMIVRRQMTNPS